MKTLIIILSLVYSFSAFAVTTPEGDESTQACERVVSKLNLPTAEKMQIAFARSTDAIVQFFDQGQLAVPAPDLWITIDLVQDQSHAEKLPPIPGFAFTWLARGPFNKKIQLWIADGRDPKDFPKLKKMYFEKGAVEYREISATTVAHTIVHLQVKDLPTLMEWFVDSMYHPVLGNKVFKIQLVPN